MTRSLSNLIKAYAIRYPEEKRKLDMNEKAEKKIQQYIQNRMNVGQTGEFVEGIPGLKFMSEQELSEEEKEKLGSLPAQPPQMTPEQIEELLAKEREENRKRIEEDTEEILEEARGHVAQMLNDAKNRAESMKNDILRQAREDGYEDGKQRGIKEVNAIKEALEKEKRQHEKEYTQMVEQLEPKVASLLISLVQKLTGVLIEEKQEIILHLIEQAFLETEGSKSFLVRVSKEDYDFVSSHKTELLWKLKEGTELEIIKDPALYKGQCMVETDSKIIDSSLDVQLKGLIADLKLLAGEKEKSFVIGEQGA